MASSSPTFLHGLIRKEARCLLQYLADATPWTASAQRGKLADLLGMAHRERELIDALIRHCLKSKLGSPVLGPYPHSFMDINFVALDFLLPLLRAEQKKRIGELEWSLLTTPESARDLVRKLIQLKRDDLTLLDAMAA